MLKLAIKTIQKYADVTQTQLAEMLGVSFPTLNSWINGKSNPRRKALEKIDSIYIEYTGDVDIAVSTLSLKKEKLVEFKKQYTNPFAFIMSRKDIYDSFLLEMTYHTNSIEGSTFNEPEVKAVLFDDVTIPNKTVREHQEAKNHSNRRPASRRHSNATRTQPATYPRARFSRRLLLCATKG